MKIVLIGATGFVGSKILEELLNRNHTVTAVLRNPEKLQNINPLLFVVKGDVFDEPALSNLFKGQDLVISAYNPGWSNPEIYADFIKGSTAILKATKAAGVARLIIIGGAGSLYLAPGIQLIDTPEFPAAIKPGAQAARDFLETIKTEKELDWTYFSPAIEMHQGTAGIRRGTYRTALENPVFDENGRSILSVEDVAVVIADEIEHPKHSRQRFTAAY
jgi:putative NADH-flavin reductase